MNFSHSAISKSAFSQSSFSSLHFRPAAPLDASCNKFYPHHPTGCNFPQLLSGGITCYAQDFEKFGRNHWKRQSFVNEKIIMNQNVCQSMRLMVEQLRIEVKVSRMKISQTSQELVRYCEQHSRRDPLVVGVPSSENPFREKTSCILL